MNTTRHNTIRKALGQAIDQRAALLEISNPSTYECAAYAETDERVNRLTSIERRIRVPKAVRQAEFDARQAYYAKCDADFRRAQFGLKVAA